MNPLKRSVRSGLILLACAGWASRDAMACATCFGASDSLLAQGMNMGILSLLAVILTVLVSVASFFVMLARRAAAVAAKGEASTSPGNL